MNVGVALDGLHVLILPNGRGQGHVTKTILNQRSTDVDSAGTQAVLPELLEGRQVTRQQSAALLVLGALHEAIHLSEETLPLLHRVCLPQSVADDLEVTDDLVGGGCGAARRQSEGLLDELDRLETVGLRALEVITHGAQRRVDLVVPREDPGAEETCDTAPLVAGVWPLGGTEEAEVCALGDLECSALAESPVGMVSVTNYRQTTTPC